MKKINVNHKDRLVSFSKSKLNRIITNTYDGVTKDILEFVARSKFTSAHNISMLLNSKDAEKDIEYIDYLIEQDLLEKREIVFGPDLYSLTTKGAKLMEVKKFRVNQVNLWAMSHALIAQSETILAMKQYKVIQYEFEPQDGPKSTRPDAIWIYQDKTSGLEVEMRVEIELTEKPLANGKMAIFFEKLFSKPTVVVFTNKAIMNKYYEIAEEYWFGGVPLWRNVDSKWFNTGARRKVTIEEMINVSFKMAGEKHTVWHQIYGRVFLKKR